MRVAIGADHAGFDLKAHLVAELGRLGHEADRPRHPRHGVRRLPADLRRGGRAVVAGDAERGIVLGGSGQGEQIAANKVHGVRAALCNDLYTARLSREHNDANVLSMGGRIVASGLAERDPRAVARHPVRGRPPRAPGRPDRRHRARGESS